MPWSNISAAKKDNAITTYLGKPLTLAAINKLYGIYDAIKNDNKKVKNPMAFAWNVFKRLIFKKKGKWELKPESEKTKKETLDEAVRGGFEGSFEDLRDNLRSIIQKQYPKTYVYVLATFKKKVIVSIDAYDRKDGPIESGDYEIGYEIKKGKITVGIPKKIKIVSKTKDDKGVSTPSGSIAPSAIDITMDTANNGGELKNRIQEAKKKYKVGEFREGPIDLSKEVSGRVAALLEARNK